MPTLRFHMTATPRFHMTATPRFHRPPPVEGVISPPPGFTVPLLWRGLSVFTPSLEGESKGVELYAHLGFYMTATRFHMTATPRFHRPPPVEGVISPPPGFTVPLLWRGLLAFTPSLEGESKGVEVLAHSPVSHDRHPPVSHDCHPPVSPSPSGGGGYQPTPRFHRPPPVEGVTHHHPLFRGGIKGGGVLLPREQLA